MTAKGKVDAVKAAEDNNGLNDMARTVQGLNGVRPCDFGMFADERKMAIERYLTFMKEIEEEPPISSGDRSDIAEIPDQSVVPDSKNRRCSLLTSP